MDALLVLEDGRVFPGRSFGAEGETTGEFAAAVEGCLVVFRIRIRRGGPVRDWDIICASMTSWL